MDSFKKQGLLEICITAVKVLLYIMLVFNGFVFIYYGFINQSHPIEHEAVLFINDFSVSYTESGDQSVSSVLPEDIKDNEYFFFDTRKDVDVYINGEKRADFIEKRDVNIPGGSTRRFIMSVPLKAADSGAEITIIRHNLAKTDTEPPEVFIGTRYGALSYMFRSEGLLFALSLIVLIFSFVSFVVSLVLRFLFRQKITMTYGALGIFAIAAWLLTDSFLFPYVFGAYHVNALLCFIFCLMIPLPLAIYLTSMQQGRYKKSMSVLIILSIINAVLWPFLHFTGILPIYDALNLANALLVVLSASGIIILLVDAIKGNVSDFRYTFTGFLGFLVSCIIELINTLLDITIIRDSIPMITGLAFFLTFIVIQQVHDLRKINTEKQHAIDISEAKTRFLASMSHEIRTPINAILGMNEMILRENNDRTIDEYSRNIKTSGKMLLMLVNDVLDFTKIESGKLEIKEADFLMSDLLYDVVSLIKERAEEKALSLVTEINGEVPNSLISDEFRIRQILINLMNNAVKYTETGSIILKVGGNYTDDGYILNLSVKDTGKGIRKEDQEHLFEAFSRADLKSNANIEGTGLGLAIVKSIIDSMEGEVGVLSEYRLGSEFWVKLPVKYRGNELLKNDFMEREVTEAPTSENGSFTAPDANILAVDDNQSNLTIVKLFLKRNGIVPDLCSTGTRAIVLCQSKKYDLILMDHMMPEPDGIETLHAIREDPASLNRDTKAFVLTANAVAGSRQMYMDAGFDDYLTKPLDPKILEDTVKNALPKDKVIETASKSVVTANASGEPLSMRDRLSAIEGLDYNTALTYCAEDEDFLKEILSDVSGEGPERSERMKKSLEAKDFKAYSIDAHSIKSSMATIGMKDFSDRAKKHEFAAKNEETDFIYADAEEFLNKYAEICEKIKTAI